MTIKNNAFNKSSRAMCSMEQKVRAIDEHAPNSEWPEVWLALHVMAPEYFSDSSAIG